MGLGMVRQNFLQNMHFHGWLAAMQVVAIRVIRRVIDFERISLFALDKSTPGVLPFASGSVRLATVRELIDLSKDPSYDLADFSVMEILTLHDLGHRCAVNIVDGRIAGYAWMAPDRLRIPKLGTVSDLLPTEVHIYKDFTHPKYRGLHGGLDRYRFWVAYLNDHGQSRALTDYAIENKASLTRVGRLKMKRVGTATLIQVGHFRKLFTRGEFKHRNATPLG